ncbi:unnamed protein product, partial [Symbiodinium sp. KB8]
SYPNCVALAFDYPLSVPDTERVAIRVDHRVCVLVCLPDHNNDTDPLSIPDTERVAIRVDHCVCVLFRLPISNNDTDTQSVPYGDCLYDCDFNTVQHWQLNRNLNPTVFTFPDGFSLWQRNCYCFTWLLADRNASEYAYFSFNAKSIQHAVQ